jgi:hypothetical protein
MESSNVTNAANAAIPNAQPDNALKRGKILVLTNDDKLILLDTFQKYLDDVLTPEEKAVYNHERIPNPHNPTEIDLAQLSERPVDLDMLLKLVLRGIKLHHKKKWW